MPAIGGVLSIGETKFIRATPRETTTVEAAGNGRSRLLELEQPMVVRKGREVPIAWGVARVVSQGRG